MVRLREILNVGIGKLADNLIWLDNILVAFQVKERNAIAANVASSLKVDRKWFKKEIIGKATSQIRDTCQYLEENSAIALDNNRGHNVQIKSKEIEQLHKIVFYRPAENLPLVCLNIKYHIRRSDRKDGFTTLLSQPPSHRNLHTPDLPPHDRAVYDSATGCAVAMPLAATRLIVSRHRHPVCTS